MVYENITEGDVIVVVSVFYQYSSSMWQLCHDRHMQLTLIMVQMLSCDTPL